MDVIIDELKPDAKDGKRLVFKRIKDVVNAALGKEKIRIPEAKLNEAIERMLKRLVREGFLERKSAKTFLTIKEAWKSRRNDAKKIMKESLEAALRMQSTLTL